MLGYWVVLRILAKPSVEDLAKTSWRWLEDLGSFSLGSTSIDL